MTPRSSARADMSAATRGTPAAAVKRIMAGVRGMGLALRGVTTERREEELMNTIQSSLRPTGHARMLTRVSRQTQLYGVVAPYAIGLSDSACALSVRNLNQVLADTMTLRDLYKKHHWQVSGPTFYSLHLLFDKHHGEQAALVDQLAERVQMLGGVSIAMAHDVAEATRIRARLAAGKRCRTSCPGFCARTRSS